MGYTHYWRRKGEVDELAWMLAMKDCANICKARIEILAGGDGEGEPEINPTGRIFINGQDDEAHETFVLPKTGAELRAFQFCKTARKPYDVVVVACLCRIGELEGIEVESDGWMDEWEEGQMLAANVLGRKIDIPLTEEDEGGD